MTTSKTENIHFRITTFFTKPDEDSRESSLFNNWLVKLLSNSKKSLNTLTRKFVGKTVEDKWIIFWKNTKVQEEVKLWYTLNAHYDYTPDARADDDKSVQFYRDYLVGTNLIVYVINNKESFENLKILCEGLQENTNKSIVVFNVKKVSKINEKEIEAM